MLLGINVSLLLNNLNIIFITVLLESQSHTGKISMDDYVLVYIIIDYYDNTIHI